MTFKILILSVFVALSSLIPVQASDSDDPFLGTILAGTTSKPKGSLKAADIDSDERIASVLGGKFKAGDRENNWRELLAAAPNADDTLNRWGYDVWAVNHELTGVKESSGALDVLKGRHGMDRVGDSADRGAENVKKALEKAANTVKGAFS